MKTLLSLFDYDGAWSQPFAQNGWDVIQLDIKHGFDINWLTDVDAVFETYGIENVDGIIAAPPCTKYAVSGARHWKKHDKIIRTLFGEYSELEQYNELVRQTLRLVNLFTPTDPEFGDEEGQGFFWAVENPVGRIAKIFPDLEEPGKPFWFDPCDFAGYLKHSAADKKRMKQIRAKDGIGITADEAKFIYDHELYTKHTGIWGDFNRDIKTKPIETVKGAPTGTVLQRAGGKSEKTKTFRSNTPTGFAQAFYEANKGDWHGHWKKQLTEEY